MMGCWAWGAAPEAYLLGLVTDTAWRFRPPFSQAASQHFPQSPRVGLLSRCTQTRRLKMHPLQAGCPRSGRQQGWLPEAALSPCPHVNASVPVSTCPHFIRTLVMLENPMDRGAQWVESTQSQKSWTQLTD